LLGKLKKAQKDSQIDPVDHAAIQAELEQTQAKLAEAQKVVKTATTEAEKLKKAYESESKVAHKLLVENGLTAALIESKVKAEFMDGALALLAPLASLKAEGENRTAVIGDKPLKDYVGEWVKSDKGKHYVAAPNNQGGGAGGGSADGGANKKTMTRTAFDALDAAEKVEFSKAGGKLTNE